MTNPMERKMKTLKTTEDIQLEDGRLIPAGTILVSAPKGTPRKKINRFVFNATCTDILDNFVLPGTTFND